MKAHAVLKQAKISAQKMRLVVDQVRGKNVVSALDILSFSHKKASDIIQKVVNSAIANAEQKGIDIDNLYIEKIYVDEGPTMKRIKPRAKGRADRILKRTSHLTVEVAEHGSED